MKGFSGEKISRGRPKLETLDLPDCTPQVQKHRNAEKSKFGRMSTEIQKIQKSKYGRMRIEIQKNKNLNMAGGTQKYRNLNMAG